MNDQNQPETSPDAQSTENEPPRSSTAPPEPLPPHPEEFQHGGFRYRQIRRTGMIAMFEQSKGGTVYGFEVVRLRNAKEQKTMGKTFPAHEKYPGNEKWGQDGWTYREQSEADARFDLLCG